MVMGGMRVEFRKMISEEMAPKNVLEWRTKEDEIRAIVFVDR